MSLCHSEDRQFESGRARQVYCILYYMKGIHKMMLLVCWNKFNHIINRKPLKYVNSFVRPY